MRVRFSVLIESRKYLLEEMSFALIDKGLALFGNNSALTSQRILQMLTAIATRKIKVRRPCFEWIAAFIDVNILSCFLR